MSEHAAYRERILQALEELGVPARYADEAKTPMHLECAELTSIGMDMFGREQRLEPGTAAAWHQMVAAAAADGAGLLAVSGFRSFDYQKGIISRKLARGLAPEEIFRASAVPGFSEHHTGRAIDISTPGSEPLEEVFETTDAFRWLARRAGEFGFTMSYPRDNPFGIIYEPWHWCRQAA